MEQYNILLLCGGDGSEHDISLVSASYIEKQLKTFPEFNVIKVVIHRDGWVDEEGRQCNISHNQKLYFKGEKEGAQHVDYVIPCIHGVPGETGDIQSLLEMLELPYFGCGSEASKLCFNKISTKLWLSAIDIPNTPFSFIDTDSAENLKKAHDFFKRYGSIFVKAASQGSSVGCYKVCDESELDGYIKKAFTYSDDVLLEQAVKPRELEVAAYEYQGRLIITNPGEIITPDNDFYTFEEKYNSTSKSTTMVEAVIPDAIREEIREYAARAFRVLKLKDLSRIDFFLVGENQVLLNEINTFPGMTPISMFPKMLEHHGEKMTEFLRDAVVNSVKSK